MNRPSRRTGGLFPMACVLACVVFVGAVIRGWLNETSPDLRPKPAAMRCTTLLAHEAQTACMAGLCATALNDRQLGGVTCHGDLGAPAPGLRG